jgi:hypothetical protein
VFLIVTFPTFQQHFARFIIIGTAAAVDDQPDERIDWNVVVVVEDGLSAAHATFQ